MAIININKRFRWVEQWQLKDTKIKTFNDGRLVAGMVIRKRDGRSRVIGAQWTPSVKLPYGIVSIREQDREMAYQTNMQLDLKIRVPKNKHLEQDMTVKIDGEFYEIKHKDYGHDATYLFLQKRTGSDPEITEVANE